MNTVEAHIDFKQKLNMVAAHTHQGYKPLEIDWWLYEALIQFIKGRTKPKPFWTWGSDAVQARVDNLEYLVTEYTADVFVDNNDSRRVYINLPDDYFMLIDDNLTIKRNCAGADTILTETLPYYYAFVPMPNNSDGTANEYWAGSDFKAFIDTGSEPVLYQIDTDAYPDGLTELDYQFLVEHMIRDYPRTDDYIELYWEKWNGFYQPNTWIVVLNPNLVGNPLNVRFDFDVGTDSIEIFTSLSLTGYESNSVASSTTNSRLVRHEDLGNLYGNTFTKPTYKSPVTTIKDKRLYIYNDGNFKVTSLTITYLRRPRRFNYETGQSFEVDDQFHNEIVDKAVDLVMSNTVNPVYQMRKAENQFNN